MSVGENSTKQNCDVEYKIKEFLPSKKAQNNYRKFLKDLNKIQKKKSFDSKLVQEK